MQSRSLQPAVEACFSSRPSAYSPTAAQASTHSVDKSAPAVPWHPFLLEPEPPAVAPPPPCDRVSARGITVTRADVARVAPVVTFHPQEKHFPCDIDDLLAGACLTGANGQTVQHNLTPADLGRASPEHRVWLDKRHAVGGTLPAGHRITAPMYVAVQVPEDRAHVDIRYIFLFGYQGAQIARVLLPGNDFDTFLPHFGEHEADIESVCVRLTPDLQHVTHVTFEEHGKPCTQPASDVSFIDGHPIARCSLEDHATYNARGLADDARIEHLEETRKPIPGFGVAFVDLVSAHGARWAPHEQLADAISPFVFVGFDKAGAPINAQTWTRFDGGIGGSYRNAFSGAQGIDRPLSFFQRNYVNGLVKAVEATGKLEERRRISLGTEGLGARHWLVMEP